MAKKISMKHRQHCYRRISIVVTFLLMAIASSSAQASGTGHKNPLLYVGTYTENGSKGIYAYRFDSSSGNLSALGLAAESVQPSFLAVDRGGRFLYAVNEIDKFNGQPTGAVSAFGIQPESGKLTFLNQISARDKGPAHIILDRTGKYALVSNYPKGSVAVFPILKDGRLGESTSFVQHHGSSVDRERQEGPHAHAAVLSPDNRFAIVADLGLDQVLVYRFNQEKGALEANPQIVKVAPGAGPRHLVFGTTGKFLYLINEMQSAVVTYSYDSASGGLHELQTITTLSKGFHGSNTAAEIEVDPAGKFLYASNRGDDTIAVFAINTETGRLTPVENDAAGGKTPRNFEIDPSGSWLLVADQESNRVVVFRINRVTGHLTQNKETVQVASPVCLKFVTH